MHWLTQATKEAKRCHQPSQKAQRTSAISQINLIGRLGRNLAQSLATTAPKTGSTCQQVLWMVLNKGRMAREERCLMSVDPTTIQRFRLNLLGRWTFLSHKIHMTALASSLMITMTRRMTSTGLTCKSRIVSTALQSTRTCQTLKLYLTLALFIDGA